MREIISAFTITKEQLIDLAGQVEKEMEKGLAGSPSDFAMLPSYLPLPTAKEKGCYLALDFGGSNLRVAKVSLQQQEIIVESRVKKSLKELLVGTDVTVEELFENIAQMINEFAPEKEWYLGHTFSYPALQQNYNLAYLKNWTKEMAVKNSDGFNINQLLSDKLEEIGRADIRPNVILNDTAAVLVTGAYQTACPNIIGSICGTGHNTAYYEPDKKMIINIESGNFSVKLQNKFDKILDAESISPGGQILEKMVTGNYLTRLLQIVCREVLPELEPLESAEELELILQNESHELHSVAKLVLKRAAQLVAAEYLGICQYLAKKNIILEKIAIDGSIYNKISFFQIQLKAALAELIKNPPEIVAGNNWSLQGAAVACALIKEKYFKA